MRLRFLGKETQSGNSPTLWAADETDEYVIQGFMLDSAALAQVGTIPEGELVIRVPKKLMEHLPKGSDGVDDI